MIGRARQLDLTAFTLADLDTQRGFVRDRLSIPSGTTAERPAEPFTDIRYNETLGNFEGYNGTSWTEMSADHALFLLLDGTRPMTGSLLIGVLAQSLSFGQKTVQEIDSIGDSSNREVLALKQLDDTLTAVDLIDAGVSSEGDVVTEFGGDQFVRLPRGTTAQRGDANGGFFSTTGGEIRVNSDFATRDVAEFFDGQDLEWIPLQPRSENITFTATNVFAYQHDRGLKPLVLVTDSDGEQIEVLVTHTSLDIVVINFGGTITNGFLILS